MDTATLAELDRRTSGTRSPSSAAGKEAPVMIERAEGCTLYDTDGNALHRRRLVALVHRPRPPPPADRRGGAGAARPRRAHDDARPLAPRRGRAGGAAGAIAPPGLSASSSPTTARRRPRWRSRWPTSTGSARRAAAHGVRLPARRLPRRHDRLGLGRRDRPLPRDVPASCCSTPTTPSRATPATCGALLEAHGERVAAVDRRAARAGRGGDDRAPRRATCARCASCATSTACC